MRAPGAFCGQTYLGFLQVGNEQKIKQIGVIETASENYYVGFYVMSIITGGRTCLLPTRIELKDFDCGPDMLKIQQQLDTYAANKQLCPVAAGAGL